MWWCTLVYLCSVVTAVRAQGEGAQSRLVQTAQGPVRGHKDPDGGFFTFHSIPYATAPTGPSKFKAPLPPPSWLQALEAIDRHIICPQASLGLMHALPEHLTMQEDCLFANVYIPDTEKIELPVLVLVHGGAFQFGYGDWMTLKNFSKDKKIIVVTFNYRLGIHGFLCLGTKDAPGNAGMKDQVALLRWVKKNIANFGGNPNDVTIAGGSAGSASVDLLMLSKSAKGLFTKVIADSGANVGVFVMQPDPLENAKWYARLLNFTDVDNIYALEEFYKTAPLKLLTLDSFIDRTDSSFVFSPCVERDIGEEVFLNDNPVNILKTGNYRKVPLLYGFTNMEGLVRVGFLDMWKHKMNEKFSDFLPADLIFENEKQREEVAKKIKEFYFADKLVGDDTILAYIDYFTDVTFVYAHLRAVTLHLEAGNDHVYLYEYSFVDADTPVVPHTNVRGADHCAQTMAVFDGFFMQGSNETSISEELKKMKAIMREIWSNFVNTGQPVPEGSLLPKWPPVSGDRAPHMSLGTTLELKGSPLQLRARFWDDIYQRYYRTPLPPATPPPKPHSEL